MRELSPEFPALIADLDDEDRRALAVLTLAQRNRYANDSEAWVRAWAAAMNDMLCAV